MSESLFQQQLCQNKCLRAHEAKQPSQSMLLRSKTNIVFLLLLQSKVSAADSSAQTVCEHLFCLTQILQGRCLVAYLSKLMRRSNFLRADYSEMISRNRFSKYLAGSRVFKAALSEQMLQSRLLKADASKHKFQNKFHDQIGRAFILTKYSLEKLAACNLPKANDFEQMSQSRLFRDDCSKPISQSKERKASIQSKISTQILHCKFVHSVCYTAKSSDRCSMKRSRPLRTRR